MKTEPTIIAVTPGTIFKACVCNDGKWEDIIVIHKSLHDVIENDNGDFVEEQSVSKQGHLVTIQIDWFGWKMRE